MGSTRSQIMMVEELGQYFYLGMRKPFAIERIRPLHGQLTEDGASVSGLALRRCRAKSSGTQQPMAFQSVISEALCSTFSFSAFS
jgi:hypothetical protein